METAVAQPRMPASLENVFTMNVPPWSQNGFAFIFFISGVVPVGTGAKPMIFLGVRGVCRHERARGRSRGASDAATNLRIPGSAQEWGCFL